MMKFNRHIIFYFIFCATIHCFSQDIEKHQWKERVLLIITTNEETIAYTKQIAEFNDSIDALKDRKLVIYRVSPRFYKTGLNQTKKNVSTKLYKKYKKAKASVEVVLIGLDGGVKLRKTPLVSKKEVFDLIDSMPMRRNEIKNKN